MTALLIINLIVTLSVGCMTIWYLKVLINYFEAVLESYSDGSQAIDRELNAYNSQLESLIHFLSESKNLHEASDGRKNDWVKIRKAFTPRDVDGRG